MLADYLRQLRQLSINAKLYLISNTIQAVSAGALAVLYTLYLQALGYTTDFIALVIIIGTIGGALGIIPANTVVRRWGWRATLIWSDVIGAIALGAQLVYPTRPVVLVTTLGIGASVALLLVVNVPLLATFSTDADRTALLAINNALAFLAGVVGLLLGGFLPAWLALPAVRDSAALTALSPWLVQGAEARTYELALLATGALALPSIIPILLLREAPRSHEPAPPRPARSFSLPTRDDIRHVRAIALGPIGRFSLTQTFVGAGAGLFGPYINIYFVKVLGASTALYGTLASALTILLALGSLAIVPFADRLGKIRSAVLAQSSSLPFLLAIGLAPTLLIAAVAFLIRGPLMNAAGPPLQAYYMETVPTEQRVLASGVYNVSWQLAWSIGAGIGGVLIGAAGYPPVFVAAAVLYALSTILVAIWFGHNPPASASGTLPGAPSHPAESPAAPDVG
jgi:MFS family permease